MQQLARSVKYVKVRSVSVGWEALAPNRVYMPEIHTPYARCMDLRGVLIDATDNSRHIYVLGFEERME